MNTTRTDLTILLWRNVGIPHDRPDGCWVWLGAKGPFGHGHISYRGVTLITSRVAWTLECGPIPEGLHVLHRCDNGACVRPDHLFLGTHQDNMADKVAKGRQARGEKQGSAKLTEAQVREMRALAAQGVTRREIARRFNVSEPTASLVVRGKRWSHVTDERTPS